MSELDDFDALMDFICIELGFCGCRKNGKPLHVSDIIPSTGLIHVDNFVDWVFLADDMNPTSDPVKWQKHKNAIRDAFIRILGETTVDANRLKTQGVH